jgi:hypothetical protein
MHSDPDTSCPPVKILCDEKLPSVAVVIPCWNAGKSIARAIDSVLDQDYLDLEVIVIDDGSTDGSLDAIKAFGNKLLWTSGPNRGACVARNQGLAGAQAEYILFLDADDFLEPGSLRAWARCAKETNADIVFGPFAYEQAMRRVPGASPRPPVTSEDILCQWLKGWFTPPCSVLWRRFFVAGIGGWNSTAMRNQDGELVVRALLHDPRIAVANAGLGVYVQHASPDRVSKRAGYSVIASELESLTSLWQTAQVRCNQDLQLSFAHAFYRTAYMAYAAAEADLGSDALSMARKLGLRWHVGSAIHCIASSVLGLRTKLFLSGLIKGRIAFKQGGASSRSNI